MKNKLILIQELQKSSKDNRRLGLYKCECGNQKTLVISYVNRNLTRSCGCLKSRNGLKHGLKHTPEYEIWKSMKQRCNNPKNKQYKDYGGRGIGVCEEWMHDFNQFYRDIGPRPSNKYMLERIDNNLGYSKNNCRWSTRKEQMNNMRTNRFIDFMGEKRTLEEWIQTLNLSSGGVKYRIYTCGWKEDEAISFYYQKNKSGGI